MKILVTGAAGAVGSHLAERLVKEGHKVVGIDALTSYYDSRIKRETGRLLEEEGIEMHYKNLLEDETLELAKDAQVIFHMAAQPGISTTTPFNDYLNNNIVATYKLLEAVREDKSLEAFINASTSSIYGAIANSAEDKEPKPISWYGVTKLGAEQLALSYYRSFKLPVINLRLFSVYGERERPEKFFHKLIKAMYENKEITLYEGSDSHVRSYSYIADIVDGCMKVLGKRLDIIGETFNLGNDKTNTTGEGLKYVEEIMGKKAKIKIVPRRSGDQLETAAKIRKAREILGYDPKTDLKTGLAKEISWYRNSIHGKF